MQHVGCTYISETGPVENRGRVLLNTMGRVTWLPLLVMAGRNIGYIARAQTLYGGRRQRKQQNYRQRS